MFPTKKVTDITLKSEHVRIPDDVLSSADSKECFFFFFFLVKFHISRKKRETIRHSESTSESERDRQKDRQTDRQTDRQRETVASSFCVAVEGKIS